jgi:hypothetical protein
VDAVPATIEAGEAWSHVFVEARADEIVLR